MIDLRQLFIELAQVVRGAGSPDAETTAKRLDLDVSSAKIAKTKRGLLTIYGAHLRGDDVVVDLIASVAPRRAVDLLFKNSGIPYRAVEGQIFGADQRVQHSKHSDGFAILFQEGELTCGLTASGLNGVVDSVFCKAPRGAQPG